MLNFKRSRPVVVLWGALIFIGMQSCQTNKMATGGTFFGDVDKYFNQTEGISVWVYRAFQPREAGVSGLRLTNRYPLDSRILQQTGLAKKHSLVLFSVVPEEKPYYNLLAIKHTKRNVDLTLYELIKNEDSSYHQRDFSWNGMVIRHVYIPYGQKYALSFLYYITVDEHRQCPFCTLDYLVKINAKSFPQTEPDLSTWQIFECSDTEKVEYELTPERSTLAEGSPAYLRIYEQFAGHKLLCYFRLLKDGVSLPFSIRLCPGKYYIEYSSVKHEVLERSTVNLERKVERGD